MRVEYFGRFDYRDHVFIPPEIAVSYGGICLLDGQEVKEVWFADTVEGVLKTYDVLGDGEVHAVGAGGMGVSDFPGREVEAPEDGVFSETRRGLVRIFGPERD